MSMQEERGTYEGDLEPPPDEEKRGSSAMVRRDGFDGIEVAKRNELAAAAVQARSTAMVQAKYVMAARAPRDAFVVREKILTRCAQLDFAEVARYRRPQGKKKNEATGKWEENFIEGPSIRFVEEMIRCNKNMGIESAVLYDDDEKQIMRVAVVDYEDVTEAAQEFTVYKTIERRELKRGQRPLATRTNSYGDTVYILPATDDDVRMKVARLQSMTIRQLGLRMLPGGVVAEAQRRILQTIRDQDKGKDPLAVRRATADKFAAMGISAAAIAEYFGGKPIDKITDEELLELRIIGATISNGEASWREIMDGSPHVEEGSDTGPDGDATPKNEAQAKVQKTVKETLAKRVSERARAAAPAAPTAPATPADPNGQPPAQAPAQAPADAGKPAQGAGRKPPPRGAAQAPAPSSLPFEAKPPAEAPPPASSKPASTPMSDEERLRAIDEGRA